MSSYRSKATTRQAPTSRPRTSARQSNMRMDMEMTMEVDEPAQTTTEVVALPAHKRSKITSVLSHLRHSYDTRFADTNAILGCKHTMFLYVIYTVSQHLNLLFKDDANRIIRAFHIINQQASFCDLYNNLPPHNSIPIRNFYDLTQYGKNIFPMTIVKMGISPSGHRQPYISHYFLIIFLNDKFYVVSSYGSDNVTIPLNQVELDPDDLTNLCMAFSHPHSRDKLIDLFFRKYFLLDGFTTTFTDAYSDKKEYVSHKKGSKKEVSEYIVDEPMYQVCYLPTFIDDITSFILGNITAMGINKFKPHKKKSNKKKKLNKKRKTMKK